MRVLRGAGASLRLCRRAGAVLAGVAVKPEGPAAVLQVQPSPAVRRPDVSKRELIIKNSCHARQHVRMGMGDAPCRFS